MEGKYAFADEGACERFAIRGLIEGVGDGVQLGRLQGHERYNAGEMAYEDIVYRHAHELGNQHWLAGERTRDAGHGDEGIRGALEIAHLGLDVGVERKETGEIAEGSEVSHVDKLGLRHVDGIASPRAFRGFVGAGQRLSVAFEQAQGRVHRRWTERSAQFRRQGLAMDDRNARAQLGLHVLIGLDGF